MTVTASLIWVCEHCGSANVDASAWIDINTEFVKPGDGPRDKPYCNDCEDETRCVQVLEHRYTTTATVEVVIEHRNPYPTPEEINLAILHTGENFHPGEHGINVLADTTEDHLQQYWDQLAKFDWGYERTEDSQVFKRCYNERKRLERLSKQSPLHAEIWRGWCDYISTKTKRPPPQPKDFVWPAEKDQRTTVRYE